MLVIASGGEDWGAVLRPTQNCGGRLFLLWDAGERDGGGQSVSCLLSSCNQGGSTAKQSTKTCPAFHRLAVIELDQARMAAEYSFT